MWHTTHSYECIHNTSRHARIKTDLKCCPWVTCMWHDFFYTCDVDTFTDDTRLIHMSVYIIRHVQITADLKRCPWVTCMWHDSIYTCGADAFTGDTRLIHMSVYKIRHAQIAADFKHLHLQVTHDLSTWVYTKYITSRANQHRLQALPLSHLHVTWLFLCIWPWLTYMWHMTYPYECIHNTSRPAQVMVTADFKRSPWVICRDMTLFMHVTLTNVHVTHNAFTCVYM